jgi:hypothetical protein
MHAKEFSFYNIFKRRPTEFMKQDKKLGKYGDWEAYR